MQPREQGVGAYVGHQQHEEGEEEVEVEGAGLAGGQEHVAVGGQGVVPAVKILELTTEQSAGKDGEEGEGAGTANLLSERECEIVRCVVRGMANKQIAEQLFISLNTVLTHRKNISRKLNIHSVAGLTIYAIAAGLVSLEEAGIK